MRHQVDLWTYCSEKQGRYIAVNMVLSPASVFILGEGCKVGKLLRKRGAFVCPRRPRSLESCVTRQVTEIPCVLVYSS